MFRAEPLKKRANYYSIKKDDVNGLAFRLTTTREDPEAVARPYSNPKTGEEGVAYERAYKSLYGVITDISFHENTLKDGTVLRSINIELGEDEGGVLQIVSIPVDSRYTTDFLKRLPNINFTEEVKLTPYDFEKEGPRQVGISIHQKGDSDEFTIKVPSDYFVKVEEKDGKRIYTNLHGFPAPTEEDESDWPFYFKKVSKFLVKYAQEHVIPTMTGTHSASITDSKIAAHKDAFDEVFPDKPPF